MKKFFWILAVAIFAIAGCASPAPIPTSTPAKATPLPSATNTPVLTATFIPTPTATPLGLPDNTIPSGYGVNIHYSFVGPPYLPAAQFLLLRDAHIGFIRDGISPGGACYQPPWCFGATDDILQKANRLKLRLIFLLNHQDNRALTSEEDIKAFARFAKDAVTRYKGHGIIWELWGEPDGAWSWAPKGDPQQYSILASATIDAMRKADPNVIIIGPNVATLDTIFDDAPWGFLKGVGDAGALTKFDAINVHLHNGGIPESQLDSLLRLRRLIDSYSPDRKIPITSSEWGYTTSGKFYEFQATQEEQTKFLVRSFLFNSAHEINLSLWYTWKNIPQYTVDVYDIEFGIITEHGDPKPAYYALRILTTTLDGYQFVRRIATESTNDYLLLFRKGDQGILAAWTTAEPRTLIIPNVPSDIDSIQMMGEKQTLKADANNLAISITQSPQYLLLPSGIIGDEGIFWKPDGTFFRLDQQGQAEIPIVIENPSAQAQTFNIQAMLDDSSIGSINVTLKPNQTQIIQLPIEITANPDQLDFMIKIIVSSQEKDQTAWIWVQR